jgi:hypothetical protein
MKYRKFLGGLLIVGGVGLTLESFVGITGFVVGPSGGIDFGFVLGFVFVAGGVGLMMSGDSGYFKRRADELVKNSEDAYVSQWELNGIVKELDKGGFILAHGNGYIAESHGSFPRHTNVEGYNKNGVYLRKHLVILKNPRDKRLFRNGDLVSKVYHPKHQRDVELPDGFRRKGKYV